MKEQKALLLIKENQKSGEAVLIFKHFNIFRLEIMLRLALNELKITYTKKLLGMLKQIPTNCCMEDLVHKVEEVGHVQ